MRTITKNIYTYEELSQDAKKKAIDSVRQEIGGMLNDNDNSEYNVALGDIEDVLDIKVYRWEVGAYCQPYFKFRLASAWQGMDDNPRFLLRYLRTISERIIKGRYYSKNRRSRHSHVLMDEEACNISGTWCDCAIEKTLKNRYSYVARKCSIHEFLEDMLAGFFNNWQSDLEYAYEDECIEGMIMANEYEFTENGEEYTD